MGDEPEPERTEPGSDRGASGDRRLDRRSYLKATGVTTAGFLAALGASGSAGAAATRHGISFSTVYDAVADLGMDPSGTRSIDRALANVAGDDTLVEFPPGRYLVNDTLTLSDVSNFGIVGSGGRNDVEFVTQSGNKLTWIAAREGENLLFENFTMQQTRDRTTSFRCVWLPKDGLHVENVKLAGWNPRDDTAEDPGPGIAPGATAQWGVATVRNFVCTGGGVVDFYPSRRVPIWVGKAHEGEVRFVDCHVAESGSHSMYASRTPGVVRVEGGLYENNDNTNLRVSAGGHPSKDSWVKGATIVCDTDAVEHLPDGERYQNMRGIRVESRKYGHAGLLIEDCDFVYKNAPRSSAVVEVSSTHGATTIRNCRFRSHVDGIPFVNAKAVEWDGPYGQTDVDGPARVAVEGCSFTGDAKDTRGTVRISGRDGSTVTDCCFDRPHDDGVVFRDCENAAVVNSTVDVGGRAVVKNDSTVKVDGITSGGSCPLPNDDRSGLTDGSGDDDSGTDGEDSAVTSELPHAITFYGKDGACGYQLGVSGRLERTTALGATVDPDDSVEGSVATGWVDGGKDSYAFSGGLTDLSVSGDPVVYLDGTEVDPDVLRPLENELVIDGSDLAEGASYEVVVDGELKKSWVGGATKNDSDRLDGGRATGLVFGGIDSYTFSGSVTDFSVEGGTPAVRLNGTAVNPAELGRLPNSILVDASGVEDFAHYEFTVSGDVRKADAADPHDSVSGSTATGRALGGTDAFTFSGEITDFSTDRDLRVVVDGEETAHGVATPSRGLTVHNRAGSRTDYRVETTGRIAATDASRDDTVGSRSAEGSVWAPWRDAFAFDGQVRRFVLEDVARVVVDRDAGTIEISDNRTGEPLAYRFGATGGVESTGTSAEVGASGTVVEGRVGRWYDTYTFSGDLTEISVGDSVTVTFTEG